MGLREGNVDDFGVVCSCCLAHGDRMAVLALMGTHVPFWGPLVAVVVALVSLEVVRK